MTSFKVANDRALYDAGMQYVPSPLLEACEMVF